VTSGDRESERLTALGGLAALSLDALSSVAYGPEAILVVLVAAGTAGLRFSLPVTGAIVVLLAGLIISYRQVIEAFPNGGGAYAARWPSRSFPTCAPSRPKTATTAWSC
jgi:amino acid transporter